MQYAIRYFRNCRTLPMANEIIIRYKEKNTELIDFVQKYDQEKRIVADVTGLESPIESLEIFKAVISIHKNFAILTSKKDENIIDYYENNINFFFIEGADCLDELEAQVNMHVSDVYILNELAFSIKRIAPFLHENNIKVRMLPNVAQTRTETPQDTFKQFFIRPDDVVQYEGYVDIFEFFGPLDKQSVLYEIYNKGQWLGNLKDLILGLKVNVYNPNIVPYFASSRLDCGKRCAYGKCNVCGTAKILADTLTEKNLEIRVYERNANEKNMQIEPAKTVSSDETIFETT